MMRRLLLSLATCLPILHATAQDGLWSPVSKSSLQPYLNGRSAVSTLPSNYELVKLNRSMLQQLQKQVPLAKVGQRSLAPVSISLPLPESGKSISSGIAESPILSDALSKQLPDFKTYELIDPATHSLQGRLTVTSQGVTGFIFTKDGSAYINPVNPDYPDVHMVYYIKDIPTLPIQCGVKDLVDGRGTTNRISTVLSGDCKARNYKLAVAATGEYTVWAGSQAQALTYIGTLVNDVQSIYQRDAAITFTLVSTNNIIYTDSLTDPYPTRGFPDLTILNNNHSAISSALGLSNFDEGIVLNNGWNGGLAYLGVVCDPTHKGGGAAGLTGGTGSNPTAGPQGPIFTGTVAHEMAHQFSATHSFTATNGACVGNPTPATAYEPGGGSTIMAYAGPCTGNSYQPFTDLYFHGASIAQIDNYAVNFATCETPTSLSNTAPNVTVAASSYTIPVSTPFMLMATGTDAEKNTLYYCWEEMDAGDTSTAPPSATAIKGPNFRSYPPTTANTRVFPRLADVISGTTNAYELLPSVARAMNFQVTVRDEATGGGCTAQQTVTVNTSTSASPFTVTSQSSATTWAANGSNTATITWNVSSTTAAPFNVSNVDILFSSDGGLTFPDTLATNTANDGTQAITIPSLVTTAGRVMVKARGNIFFNVNTANITITSSCSASGATFSPTSSVSGNAGSSNLDLSLSPVYGLPITISGKLESTDPTSTTSVLNTSSNTCQSLTGFTYQYDTYRFTPSATGTYTFTLTGSNADIFNLYTDTFDPNNPCNNFITSSGHLSGSSVNPVNPISATLNAGLYYTLSIGTFTTGTPSLPQTYSIAVSGGTLYSSTPDPGAGFSYTYVIVDNATGLIKAIDASSNLSSASTYPGGNNYTVYGLSYSTSVSTATLNSYVGGSFTAFQNAVLYNPSSLCANVSANNVVVTVFSALPVEMLPLNAYKQGSSVNLKWATASEQNSSYFEIWRSADGISFDKLIGTVQAQGNSTLHTDYQIKDNTPLTTWNYYRVKEVDKNGNATQGNIARVNMQQNSTTLSIYPNPVQASLTLEYNSTVMETIHVRVLNSIGGLVYESGFKAQNGTNLYTIPTNTIAKGIYVVQLVSDSGTTTERFVKE